MAAKVRILFEKTACKCRKVQNNASSGSVRLIQITNEMYDGVSAVMVNNEEPPPTDMDKMAILLVGSENKTALEVAKTFHDADVLTLIVSTPDTPFETSVCGSLTVCKPEGMADAVASLLNAIIKPCMICFDFNDMNTLLEDSMHFKVGSSKMDGVDRVRNAMHAAVRGGKPQQ